MACVTNYSNGMMEGTVNKIKVIKRTMFNRASIELLRAKAIYADYGNGFT
jgi:transposase